MADEQVKVHHVYDGIEELDNRLPNWWLLILWGSILFAFGYWFYFHNAQLGLDARGQYEQDLAEFNQRRKAAPVAELSDEALLALLADPELLEEGKTTYSQSCAACHGADGQGLIGPNLTDEYWLHGADPTAIQKVIAAGVLEKGMPAWEPTLGPGRVRSVAAFVLSMRGKNLPGREPQGLQVQR
jgi:cytochrome c oxidase cbb3-type subunit III